MLAAAALTVSCAAVDTYQVQYSARAITLTVRDDETGSPLPGVVATANWELAYMGTHGKLVRGQMKVLETVSDDKGRVHFPAWGPERNRLGGHIEFHDPQISLLRNGHMPIRLSNYNKSVKPPDAGGFSRASQRISAWDGETVFMAKTGRTGRRADLYVSASVMASGLYFAFSSCDWKLIPRMTAALFQEGAVSRQALREDECGKLVPG